MIKKLIIFISFIFFGCRAPSFDIIINNGKYTDSLSRKILIHPL
jgi:hypothetical protein